MNYLYNNQTKKNFRRELRNNSTDAERKIWSILKNKQINGLRFLRQYSVGKYILDFYCPTIRLAIEIDGGQHNEEEEINYDNGRTLYLKQNDIRVLRFWNNEVLNNIEGVWEKIMEEIEKIQPLITPPNPPYLKGRSTTTD
jgi:very-short-patch-repair endonuclease